MERRVPMKELCALELVPGMVVAKNIFDVHGQLIISKDTVLTDNLITKLDLHGIWFVQVEDSASRSVPELTYSERIKRSPEFKEFQEEYNLGINTFRDALNSVVEKNIQLDVTTLLGNALDMIMNRKGQVSVLDMLHNMRNFDDSTYTHSMNVALLCNVLATWLGFNEDDVEIATACGLFHDIGKLLVPHHIISKPGKLSDEEYAQIQKHPEAGYQLLLNQQINDHVRNAALMHHERYDGTGYPNHLSGDEIDKFACIVSIADVYDAMTAARVYRGPMCPFKVIEIFESEGFQKYNVEYLLTFLENVVNTYIRNHCLLSDGREGDIIYINKEKLSRPMLKCGAEYINLADYPDLSIVKIL